MWKLVAVLSLAAGLVAEGSGVPGQDPTLSGFQREVLRRLTGLAEIRPGLTLADRASPEARDAVREYLASLLDSLGLDARRQAYGPEGENVYAVLPGTSGNGSYVLLGAHFDTVRDSPGASDNATGCALVLGVVRQLRNLPERRANVVVVFFDQEERGLAGSRAFAQMLTDEEWDVASVHTVDQMGWDEDGDGAIELELPYEGALDLYQAAAERAGFSSPIHVTSEAGSDHSAFRRSGFAAVGITEEYRNGDTTPYIHRPTDTWDTVDFKYLASVTRLVQEAMTLLFGGAGG